VRRREFIALLGGAAVGWPLSARAQQTQQMRRVGMLVTLAADDPEAQAWMAGFLQGLQELGWVVGRNVQIEARFNLLDAEHVRSAAAELVALAPDVIVTIGGSTVGLLQQATRSIPIVFALVPDPVGAGFVASLARPGGNTTGFTNFEYGMSGKWLELLTRVAPSTTRAAVLRDPSIPSGIGQFAAIQAVAPSLRVECSPIDVRTAEEIERAITEVTRMPNGGLIALPNGLVQKHRDLIIMLAAQRRIPAVYPFRFFVASGGLISYGPDDIEQFRQVATYVDRILKGTKPSDLPVQAPTKYETVINLKTAKALGLTVPPALLAIADAVIE